MRRLDPTLEGWQRNFSEFQNWVRLSSLLSALSYLESYISTVATLALRSDPLLRFHQSKTVDGVTWLKQSVPDDVAGQVLPLVKGEWPKRLGAYRMLFGQVPPAVASLVSDLDKMRQIRNGVAHSFGRDHDYFVDPLVPSGSATRLSEKRLQVWLSVIETCAESIDEHLFNSHLGEFELIWRYHRWRAEPRHFRDRGYDPHVAFSRAINRDYGSTPGRGFCRQLISYYEKT